MHELSIAGAIRDTALRYAEGRKVTLVSMRIGALRMVAGESLAFYFEMVARDTPCDGATLEHERVEALLRCPVCAHEWDPAPAPPDSHGLDPGTDPLLPHFRCPACESPRSEIVAGNELEVESIEVLEPEPEATATP